MTARVRDVLASHQLGEVRGGGELDAVAERAVDRGPDELRDDELTAVVGTEERAGIEQIDRIGGCLASQDTGPLALAQRHLSLKEDEFLRAEMLGVGSVESGTFEQLLERHESIFRGLKSPTVLKREEAFLRAKALPRFKGRAVESIKRSEIERFLSLRAEKDPAILYELQGKRAEIEELVKLPHSIAARGSRWEPSQQKITTS